MNSVNLCPVEPQTGWCRKCRLFCPDGGSGEFSCVQLEQEVARFNDDGEWDWDAYNTEV